MAAKQGFNSQGSSPLILSIAGISEIEDYGQLVNLVLNLASRLL